MRSLSDYKDKYREIASNLNLQGESVDLLVNLLANASYIEDIKKNNDYAMWLKVCKKADCMLLKESLANYRKGRKGSISTHSIKTLIGWHYKLFRYAEGENAILSVINTARNMGFGFLKKIKYVKKV